MSTSRTREKADGELFKSTGIDDNATSTAVTIDASENVLVGKTTTDFGTEGIVLFHSNDTDKSRLHVTSDSTSGGYFNRLGNDGEAIRLYRQGNLVGGVGVTSAGAYITLGGTGAANTLDDYEEGTWTATATNVAATISNTTYTKIGRVVYVTGHLVCTATATGDVTINGLPYAQKPSSNGIGTCMNYLVNVAGGSTYNFSTYLSGSGLRFYRSEDNSAWLWAGASSLYNGAQILFNLTYQTT